ncbi:MAG: DUF2332 domain-containing protein, partial [Cellvibrionaceae bacterium]|nr:DUF2332 domain-containing protein [Cellvibrionaceae bacterium]
PIHVPKQQQRLLSYIWPDQRERLARTRAACEMFSQSPNCLQRADASDWLEQAAKQFRPGRGALLFHSMFFQYLSPLQQRKLIETIEAIGKEASEQTPFYWLTFEPSADRKQAELILRQWPGGDCRKLAKGSFHGDYLTLM